MSLSKNNIFKKQDKKPEFVSFEKTFVIHPIKMFITIVPQGQANAIVKIFEECGSTVNVISSGEGTGKNFIPNLISSIDDKKQIITSLIKEENSEQVCEKLKERFDTSKASRGISLSIKLTSVAGVSIYKFLTNTRKVSKVK